VSIFNRFLILVMGVVVTLSFAQAKEQKVLNVGQFWMPANIDPAVKWNGWMLPRLGIGENLIRVNEKLEFESSLAKSWRVIDSKTIEFVVREDVVFHNGKKMTADDVRKSIKRAIETTGRKDVVFPLESIVVSGQKLTIKTSEPFPTLINVLADPVYTIVTGFDAPDFATKPIATGPFKIVSYDSTKGASLNKHDRYWGGNVEVDRVEALLMKDGTTRAMALQSGELHLATQLSYNDLEMLEKSGKFNVQKGPNVRIFMARFNLDKEHMSNPAFRQAIVHAINKDAIATNVVKGYVAKGPFPPSFEFAYRGEEPYKYDVQKAKKLLDNAGIVDGDGDGIREYKGKNIVMEFYARTGHGANAKNSGIAIQSALKKIGLKLNVNQVKSFGDILKKGDYDIVWERWTAAPTLDSLYFLQSSFGTGAIGNRGGYSSKKFDSIVKRLRPEANKKKRAQIAQEAVSLLLKDAPVIFVYHGLGSIVTPKNVTGVYRFPTEIINLDYRVRID